MKFPFLTLNFGYVKVMYRMIFPYSSYCKSYCVDYTLCIVTFFIEKGESHFCKSFEAF